MNKAILIDAINKTVREVTLPNGLQSWYDAIGCELVTVAFNLDDYNSLLVDDEGLLKQPTCFFLYKGYVQPLAGNGLIVGVDDEGNTVSTNATVDSIIDSVRFLDRAQVIEYIMSLENIN